jgi:hypothetical protein
VCDRQPEFLGRLAGQGHDLRQLLGGELARRAWAGLVGQHIDDQRLELLVGHLVAPLGLRQPCALVAPTVPPAQHQLVGHAQRRCLLDRWPPVGRPQHNMNTLGESSFDGPLPANPFQDRALPRKEFEAWSWHSHRAILILPIRQRKFLVLPPARTSSRRLLNQWTHSSVAYSTGSMPRQGPRRLMTSVL